MFSGIYIFRKGLIENLPDDKKRLRKHVNPAGIDMRIDKIHEIKGKSILLDDYKEEPTYKELKLKDMTIKGIKRKCWELKPGTYLVSYVESVNLNLEEGDKFFVSAFVLPRSTVMRFGNNVRTALGDPGYKGFWKSTLRIDVPMILGWKTRICQIVMLKTQKSKMKYKGSYQNEGKK
jgi:deoxycytidine triphosphate deaminase